MHNNSIQHKNRLVLNKILQHSAPLLTGFLVIILLSGCVQTNPELGKRLYREGWLSSGQPVSATTQGDISFSGTQFSCVNCHRRSGYGSSEGGNYVLPVTGLSLFNPRDLDRANLFKKLFKEYQPKRFTARMHMPQMRPAYTDESLAKAIREGIDPAGNRLDALMPNYQLPDQDMANLIAYLKTLSVTHDPGVDDKTIYFATVVSDNIDPDKREAMLKTMHKFIEWMNKDTRGDLRNPNFSPHYRTEFIKAYRLWKLATWELTGDPESWPQQLEHYYHQQPVFAIISGLVDGSWKPVQRLCESRELPCLFPHTELPVIDNKAVYSIYFNRGLELEADTIAHYINAHQNNSATSQAVQIYSETPEGAVPAEKFANQINNNGKIHFVTHSFQNASELITQLNTLVQQNQQPDTLILWPGQHASTAFQWLKQHPTLANTVFMPSASLQNLPQLLPTALKQRLLFSYPYEKPDAYHPRAYRVRAWMNSRGIEITHPRLQFNTYYALTLVQYGLEAIVDQFSRDYLVEYIEHEAENALNPGTFPRLSLGPGQRFASKGAYIVKLSTDEASRIITVSDWIIL